MASKANVIDEPGTGDEPLIDDETAQELDESQEADEPREPDESQDPEAGEGAEPTEADKSKTVPLSALLEERSKGREYREELTQARERMARMETLFEQLRRETAARQQPDQEDPQIPSYDEDPEGHFRGTIAALQKQVEELRGAHGERQTREQMQNHERQLMDRYSAAVRTFSAETPDFQEAYAYLSKTLDDELQYRGVDDPAERSNILLYEEGLMAGRAMRSGKNPAQLIYEYAKRKGYKPKGQTAKTEEDNKLERLKRGAEASKTIAGPGAKGEPPLTLERLAELADEDPEAFDREWEKARRKGLLG